MLSGRRQGPHLLTSLFLRSSAFRTIFSHDKKWLRSIYRWSREEDRYHRMLRSAFTCHTTLKFYYGGLTSDKLKKKQNKKGITFSICSSTISKLLSRSSSNQNQTYASSGCDQHIHSSVVWGTKFKLPVQYKHYTRNRFACLTQPLSWGRVFGAFFW